MTMPDAPVHRAAAVGFAAADAAYARGRPDYPAALDGWLVDAVGLQPGRTVVDLGAGTGKFVPRLRASGAAIVAVEPVAAMRARLAADHPDADVRDGTADAMPLDDASVDAVVCAQAFHWFATTDAMREIARVLRPGGTLALVWNVRDAAVPWMARLTAILAPYEGDAPRHHSGAWRRVFPAAGFGPLVETSFPHVHAGPPDRVIVDRVMSVSFIAALPSAERDAVAERLRAFVAAEPSLRDRATVEMPYRTEASCCRRLA